MHQHCQLGSAGRPRTRDHRTNYIAVCCDQNKLSVACKQSRPEASYLMAVQTQTDWLLVAALPHCLMKYCWQEYDQSSDFGPVLPAWFVSRCVSCKHKMLVQADKLCSRMYTDKLSVAIHNSVWDNKDEHVAATVLATQCEDTAADPALRVISCKRMHKFIV